MEQMSENRIPLQVMDWNLARTAPGQAQPVCYRWACFNCEFFRRNVAGGLIIDGQKQKSWWCVLIDERREPCKINDREGEQLTERFLPSWRNKREAALAEAFNPQPLHNQESLKGVQPAILVPTIPSLPQHGAPRNPKPEPHLPNLPHPPAVRQGRRAKKRQAP